MVYANPLKDEQITDELTVRFGHKTAIFNPFMSEALNRDRCQKH